MGEGVSQHTQPLLRINNLRADAGEWRNDRRAERRDTCEWRRHLFALLGHGLQLRLSEETELDVVSAWRLALHWRQSGRRSRADGARGLAAAWQPIYQAVELKLTEQLEHSVGIVVE